MGWKLIQVCSVTSGPSRGYLWQGRRCSSTNVAESNVLSGRERTDCCMSAGSMMLHLQSNEEELCIRMHHVSTKPRFLNAGRRAAKQVRGRLLACERGRTCHPQCCLAARAPPA